MPIEDIDYLRNNSIKQNYVFVIDSKDRDKNKFRTPSEYVVEFTQPFENVIGFEVLDASIPRTMYNVDKYNNTLRFFIYSSNYDWGTFSESSWETVTIEPGDYSVQTLVPALNSKLYMYLNKDSSLPYVPIYTEPVSNPPDIKNKLKFYCPYPFVLDMAYSSIAETLGFDMCVSESESSIYTMFSKSALLNTDEKQNIYNLFPKYEYDRDIIQDLNINTTYGRELVNFLRSIYDNNHLYKSLDRNFQISNSNTYGNEVTIFEGPRSVIRNFDISSNSYISQHFTVNSHMYLTQLEIAFSSTEDINIDTSAQYAIYKGSLTSPDISSSNLLVSGNIGVTVVDGGLSSAILTSQCYLEPSNHYWLVVYNQDNRPLGTYYNNVANRGGNYMAVSDNQGLTWQIIDEPDIPFHLSCTLIGNLEYHEIESPGIYNLVGEKYIVMRCKEIEENSYRSLAYSKHNLGLAKFRLGVVGYSDTRVDFSKVPLREFHPIGRLKKITLRFETQTGQLYDFKGVNHNITIAVHYLEPTQKERFQQSILNPNYDGNFIAYRYKEDDQEGDSDDQEEDFSRDLIGDYKHLEMTYHPDNVRIRDIQTAYHHPIFQENFNSEDYEEDDDEEY